MYNLVKEGKLSMYVSPVITHKSPRLRELGLLDEGARQILRGVYLECNECAQDDKLPGCHPERSGTIMQPKPRMTNSLAVILSAAKDLGRTYR